MENVMTNGFAELSATEMNEIDGGGWLNTIIGIAGIIVGGFACANPATAMMGAECVAMSIVVLTSN